MDAGGGAVSVKATLGTATIADGLTTGDGATTVAPVTTEGRTASGPEAGADNGTAVGDVVET